MSTRNIVSVPRREKKRRGQVKTKIPSVRRLMILIEQSNRNDKDIALRAGVSTNIIQFWRAGRSVPTLPLFEAVAGALGYDVLLVQKEDRL